MKIIDSTKEILTIRKTTVVPQKQPETIVPIPELPSTRKLDKFVEKQIFAWVVGAQPRSRLVRILDTQVMITHIEGIVRLRVQPNYSINMQQILNTEKLIH